MRRLSIKQKLIIKDYYGKNESVPFEHLTSDDNKAYCDLINNLEKINDYETLWSDTERLLWDLMMNDNLDIKNWG
jgi:hypothetical protein